MDRVKKKREERTMQDIHTTVVLSEFRKQSLKGFILIHNGSMQLSCLSSTKSIKTQPTKTHKNTVTCNWK